MNKIYFTILIVFVFLLTLFISVNQPKLHKQFIISDSQYVFVEDETPAASVQTLAPVNAPQIKKEVQKPANTTGQKPKVQKTAPSQPTLNKPQTKPKTAQKTPKPAQTAKNPPKTKAPVQKTVQKPAPSAKPPVHQLTEKEEIIAWNKWRSDVQNQVMRDTKISAPLGTRFKFSFTVDKFGNISNVKVWSTNSAYSDMGIRIIKPVLLSYQNKPILDFPAGTKRIIVNVQGGFVISTSTGYSTPSDYSDYERVKK